MTDPLPEPIPDQPVSPPIPSPEIEPPQAPDEAPPIDPGVEQPSDPRPHDGGRSSDVMTSSRKESVPQEEPR